MAGANTSSGYINTPPATDLDRRIVRGMLLYAGLDASDAAVARGVRMSPTRPDGAASGLFETKAPGIVAGLAVSIAVISAVTILRLCLRRFASALKWGLDDSLMVPGLVMAVAYPALQIAMVVYGGAGKHIYDVSYVEYYHYKWLANIASIDFYVGVGVIKMSITAFNLRLTSMTSNRWRICNWVFFATCGAYTTIALFLNIFQCRPAGASFDLLLVADRGSPPSCEGVARMGTILRTINFVLDWCLVLIPVAVLRRVQMSRGRKARLLAAMTVGSLACVASVLTLVAKERLKTDVLWNYTAILGWTTAELTIGAVAASLPTLAFLLPLPHRGSRAASAGGGGGGGPGGGPLHSPHHHHHHGHGHIESGGASSARGLACGGVGGESSSRVTTNEEGRLTMTPSSSREHLAATDGGGGICTHEGIVRTIEIEIELESKTRASSDLDSQEHAVAMYGLGIHSREGGGHP